MKVTTEIPDELYRQVKAKSALEGRPVREVAIELFRSYVDPHLTSAVPPPESEGEAAPPWFGVLGGSAASAARHDMEAIRDSIARGVRREHEHER
jgi:hypothetical protein